MGAEIHNARTVFDDGEPLVDKPSVQQVGLSTTFTPVSLPALARSLYAHIDLRWFS